MRNISVVCIVIVLLIVKASCEDYSTDQIALTHEMDGRSLSLKTGNEVKLIESPRYTSSRQIIKLLNLLNAIMSRDVDRLKKGRLLLKLKSELDMGQKSQKVISQRKMTSKKVSDSNKKWKTFFIG